MMGVPDDLGGQVGQRLCGTFQTTKVKIGLLPLSDALLGTAM